MTNFLNHWDLLRHSEQSDYGPDAYTLWPDGAILKGLSPESASLIGAAASTHADRQRLLTITAKQETMLNELKALNAELMEACKAAFFQFEHNGDESDSDKEVLNQLQAVIAKGRTA